jgi:hypothetical protein
LSMAKYKYLYLKDGQFIDLSNKVLYTY